MKHSKDRVIALDYFRGICILMILCSHSSIFSGPFSYLSGRGSPWASAAEFFFLISGITLGVVRGKAIKSDFKKVLIKSWKRARDLYIIHLLIIVASIALAGFLIWAGVTNYVYGGFPWHTSSHTLLYQTLNLSFSYGWAPYLKFYAIYMLIAPFALYALRTRFWPAVPLAAGLLLVAGSPYPFDVSGHSPYMPFFVWQAYFFIGLTIARFRVPIITWFYSHSAKTVRWASNAIMLAAAGIFTVSIIASGIALPYINKFTGEGWLPLKLKGAYYHGMNLVPSFIDSTVTSRNGVLRPFVVLLFLLAAYLLYQRYKRPLLRYTGKFVTTMGSDTLWIYVAQALTIPVLAVIPVPHDNLLVNAAMLCLLITLMWTLTQRRRIISYLRTYGLSLQESFQESKYAVLFRQSEAD